MKTLIGLSAGLLALVTFAQPALAENGYYYEDCGCDAGYENVVYDYSEYITTSDFVYADGTVTYTLYLEEGHYTEVSLWGDGYSDIDVWVMSPYGDYMGYQGEGTSHYADEFFGFVAPVSGYYEVMVENTYKPSGSYFDLQVQ
jgi:hypothetical protein